MARNTEYIKKKYAEDEEFRNKVIQSSKEWNRKNRIKTNLSVKERRQKAKDILFNHFGKKCKVCGYNNMDALVIDHINNDGSFHRKKHGNTSNEYIRYSKNLPLAETIIQLLCANCNMIKEKEYRDSVYNRVGIGV